MACSVYEVVPIVYQSIQVVGLFTWETACCRGLSRVMNKPTMRHTSHANMLNWHAFGKISNEFHGISHVLGILRDFAHFPEFCGCATARNFRSPARRRGNSLCSEYYNSPHVFYCKVQSDYPRWKTLPAKNGLCPSKSRFDQATWPAPARKLFQTLGLVA